MKLLLLLLIASTPLFARDSGRFVRRANLVKEIRQAWRMEVGQTSPIDTSSIMKSAFEKDSTAFVARRNGKLLIAQFDSTQADPTSWLMVKMAKDFTVSAQSIAGVECITVDASTATKTIRSIYTLSESTITLACKYASIQQFELDGGKVTGRRISNFKKIEDGWVLVTESRQAIGKETIVGSKEKTTKSAVWNKSKLEFKVSSNSETSLSVLLQLARNMELKKLTATAMYYAERANKRALKLKLTARDPRRMKASTTMMRLNARHEAQLSIDKSNG